MPSSVRAIAGVLALVALGACSTPPPAPRKTPKPTAVRIAFEKNFMRACLSGVQGSTGNSYCLCTRDALDDAIPDRDLPKVSPADPRFRLATHDCAAKFGLAIRPGH